MKKVRLLLLAAGALLLASCAESSTAPSQMRTNGNAAKPSLDLGCASGWIIAYDEDGNPYCSPASSATSASTAAATRRP